MIRLITGFPFSWGKRQAAVVVTTGAAGGSVREKPKRVAQPEWVYAGQHPAVWHDYSQPQPERIQTAAAFDLPMLEIQAQGSVRSPELLKAMRRMTVLDNLDRERRTPVSQKVADDELLLILAA
jgi:hypothetical protein